MPNEKQVVLSIDCGGTNLRVAAVDSDLNILTVRRGPTVRNDPERLYSTMKALIDEVSTEAKVPVKAIGISICGIVVHNKVGKCGNLGIEEGYDFESLFKRDFPNAKIKIANDANCSALVESEYGATKGVLDSAFVTISSGIGLGVVHNGEMIDLPLEGGRTMMNYRNKYYEAEYLLSGNGIVRLCEMNGIEIPQAKDFFDGVRLKDPKFIQVYNTWIGMLGIWFGNLQLMFDCQKYAVSGGVMRSGEIFLDDLVKVANASIAGWNLHPIVLENAVFAQDVGIAAGACLALHELKK
ncbi:MAG: ROK family protein [Bacilli bacterium]